MNEIQLLKPEINEKYLESSETYVPLLSELFQANVPIFIKPAAIQNTPYFLKVYCSHNEPEYRNIYVELVMTKDDEIAPIIDRDSTRTFLNIHTTNSSNMIEGKINNNSRRTLSPIKGFAQIIAPVEDAICKLAVKKEGRNLRRVVKTRHSIDSNLVQAYLRRGYSVLGVIGAVDNYIYKDF